MAVVSRLRREPTKRTLVYGAMVVVGMIFVSTLFLPVSVPVAQFIAALTFGMMSGLWLGHLVHSL